MAFGKKKQDEAPAAAAPEAAPDEQSEAEQLAPGVDDAADAAAPEADAIEAATAGETAAAPAADPLAGGDLLNMFQTTSIEAEDLSVIIELAGDAEIDDLLEELHTVALALGCQLEEVSDDEAELLAA